MTLIRNKPLLGGLAVVVVAGLAWLAFGYFGIQAAFIDNEVDEAGPVFAASQAEEFQEAMEEAEENRTEADEPAEDAVSTEAAAEEEPPEILTLASGQFAGTSRYDVSGDALVLNDGSAQRFLRFENFDSSNGPDLKVYLRAADGDFVSLGELKGNIGNQNYEIPEDVDLSVFDTVEIWCERFGVGFGSATLAA